MIQRIQTLWLLLAAILLVVTAFLPMAYLTPDGIDDSLTVFNGVVRGGEGSLCLPLLVLPVLLSSAFLADVVCIFKYNDRKRQMRLCTAVKLILFVWYVAYFLILFTAFPDGMKPEFSLNAVLPFASMICVFIAKGRIRHDENLIRSIDRIR